MKVHDFASQLELIAKFLRSLPNSEVEEAFIRDLVSKQTAKKRSTKKSSDLQVQALLPIDIEDELCKLSPAEIEQYLKSERNAFTSAQLMLLAKKIGVSVSKRQSKDALVNGIIRYYEAAQMNVMIRSTRSDDR